MKVSQKVFYYFEIKITAHLCRINVYVVVPSLLLQVRLSVIPLNCRKASANCAEFHFQADNAIIGIFASLVDGNQGAILPVNTNTADTLGMSSRILFRSV